MNWSLFYAQAAVLGLGIGFVNSIPFGPINIAIVETGLKRGFKPALLIGLGALIVDTLYCAIGIFGLSRIQDLFIRFFQPLGFPVLTFFGIRLWIQSRRDPTFAQVHPPTVAELAKNFTSGFTMYLANPLAIAFWIFVAGLLFSHDWMGDTLVEKIIFLWGMVIGTAFWFYGLARIASRRQAQMETRTIQTITGVTGIVLIGFGLYLGYRYAADAGWF